MLLFNVSTLIAALPFNGVVNLAPTFLKFEAPPIVVTDMPNESNEFFIQKEAFLDSLVVNMTTEDLGKVIFSPRHSKRLPSKIIHQDHQGI
jgi:hypothetical protein